MNRLIKIILITLFMACSLFPDSVMAGNETTHSVTMQKRKKGQTEPTEDVDKEGRRTPPCLIYCTISKTDGVNITGLSENILSYEIWDTSSELNLASFLDESEFIDFLFLQTGEFQIRFETNNFYILGQISLY